MKYNHVLMLLLVLITGVMLREFDYLPYKSLGIEVAALIFCSFFHIQRLQYIDRYNDTQDAILKQALQQKIEKRKLYLNISFSLFALIVLYGYYDIKAQKKILFNEEKFWCKSRGGQEIYVDKKDGWVLSDDYYFIKEQSLIKAFKCVKAK